MTEQKNIRNIILNMLVDTLEQGRFSHLVLNETLSAVSPDVQDRRFISTVYMGTLEQLLYLDHVIGSFSKTPLKKMKPLIKNLLRMSVYQMLFMDAVPDRAVVSEALKILNKRRLDGLKPFVNGVLRGIGREKEQLAAEKEHLPLSVRYSMPEWICRKIEDRYGKETLEIYLKALAQRTEWITLWIRNAGNETEKDKTIALLKEDGCEVQPVEGLNGVVKIRGFSSLTGLRAFAEGRIFVQDLSSLLVATVLSADDLPVKEEGGKGLVIIDVCAAPGGKSLCLADRFPEARIISMDLSEQKILRIRENAERLHLSNVEARVHDATSAEESLLGQADVVICDLPCSGLGVAGRKPDIRYRLKEEDCAELAKLQRSILAVSEAYLKPGGILLYSTCTILPEENQDNAEWFAGNSSSQAVSFSGQIPDALLTETQQKTAERGYVQLINGCNDMDGFFICKLKR